MHLRKSARWKGETNSANILRTGRRGSRLSQYFYTLGLSLSSHTFEVAGYKSGFHKNLPESRRNLDKEPSFIMSDSNDHDDGDNLARRRLRTTVDLDTAMSVPSARVNINPSCTKIMITVANFIFKLVSLSSIGDLE